jgi:hypothetical protein
LPFENQVIAAKQGQAWVSSATFALHYAENDRTDPQIAADQWDEWGDEWEDEWSSDSASSLLLVANRIETAKTARMTGTTTNGEEMCIAQAPYGDQSNKSRGRGE